MGTFVSMMTWRRSMASEDDIRARIDRSELSLWCMGMHSIIFVSDDPGGSAAVLISTVEDHAAAALIAEKLLGDALVRVDSLRFDETTGVPTWLRAVPLPPAPPRRAARRRKARQPERLAA
jgi:hypothetical protein